MLRRKIRRVKLLFLTVLFTTMIYRMDVLYQVRTIFWHSRWSRAVPHMLNRMKRLSLQKKRQNILLFWGGGGEKKFFKLSPSYNQSPKNREKSLCPLVLQLRWVISTWWDENVTLFVFSACYEIHWNRFCGRKQTKNAEIRKGACFRQGCFDRKECSPNTANKRRSR